jgi:hypothetical protein
MAFTCPHCNKPTFATKQTLQRHIERFHPGNQQSDDSSNSSAESVNEFTNDYWRYLIGEVLEEMSFEGTVEELLIEPMVSKFAKALRRHDNWFKRMNDERESSRISQNFTQTEQKMVEEGYDEAEKAAWTKRQWLVNVLIKQNMDIVLNEEASDAEEETDQEDDSE